ncbi:mitogen-activated protein kinase kinase kinase YODA-like [Miscanthus floridulus]|uniref:mitogen-activated protein kinase kinase kinase YODA-like n=1 Tax=Miscanthus floridulus TaxID=154761 RepID=UPI00345AD052
MPFWWPRRRSRPSSKRKDGPVPASASASCSPRHPAVDVVPTTAYASASASPSAQWERAWTRSLGSPAPAGPRGADRAAAAAASTLCGGGGSGPGGAAAGRGRGQGLPLPRPVHKSARGGSPVSRGSSSESDEVVDNTNHRYVDPFVYPGARTMPPDAHKRMTEEKHLVSCSAPPPREHHKFFEVPVTNAREVHLQSYEAATTGTTSRGRVFHKNTRARTRSLSPGPRGHDFASSFATPGDLGVSSRSMVKMMDDLKSQSQPFFVSSLSQPLPRPPARIASCPIPSSPIASAQSQSQWKKGKLLGSGTFGQVYLGFNRYECPYVSHFNKT